MGAYIAEDRSNGIIFLSAFVDKVLIVWLMCFGSFIASAQINLNSTYSFLSLAQSSRATALAGAVIATSDRDVAMAYANPALINQEMTGQMSINHNFHFAGIQHGFANYGFELKSLGLMAHAGFNYIDYGEFDQTDEIGNVMGTSQASDVALTLGISRQIDERLSAGINLKLISSTLDQNSSLGLVADYGINYTNPEQAFTVALVLKNLGLMLSSFEDLREPTPTDLQLAVSKRLEHLPVRFTIMGHRLEQWDLRFESQFSDQTSDLFGNPAIDETSALDSYVDNFFRHIAFSSEFYIGKNEGFKLRVGYNHLRRREMQLSQFRSLAGFSIGFGLQIKKISIDYSIAHYHLAGAVNHLGLLINFQSMNKTAL